jgi:hypothetical protein
MKRKSILALILFGVLVNSALLDGCKNTTMRPRTGTNNNATTQQGTGTGTTVGNTGTPANRNSANTNQNTGNSATSGMGTTNQNSPSLNNTGRDIAGKAADATNYTAMNFRDDFSKAGLKLKDSANTAKNYFTGHETDYMAGNDMVRVYEYGSPKDLDGDVKRISQNGLTIDGTNANYTKSPYYYRKGNSLIVYEGNEPSYVNHFNSMYGTPLIR